jgi:ureidoglycolate lyase
MTWRDDGVREDDAAMVRLTPAPLTAEAFRPYGAVIDASGTPSALANGGAAKVFRDMAAIDVEAEGGRVSVSLVRTAPTPLPLRIAVMERHPLGSQAFAPLGGAEYLAIVAPAGPLDPAAIVAFRASSAQGINLRRGVWHHPLVALYRESDFLVIDRAGAGENFELQEIAAALVIEAL